MEDKETLHTLIEEQKKTNELLEQLILQKRNPNELLTIKQIKKEFGIGEPAMRRIFADEKLPVQRYTAPFKVTRKAFEEYINEKHDYLCS